MRQRELKPIMERLKLTKAAVARLCGVCERTVRRWRDGETKMPRSARIVVDAVAAGVIQP